MERLTGQEPVALSVDEKADDEKAESLAVTQVPPKILESRSKVFGLDGVGADLDPDNWIPGYPKRF